MHPESRSRRVLFFGSQTDKLELDTACHNEPGAWILILLRTMTLDKWLVLPASSALGSQFHLTYVAIKRTKQAKLCELLRRTTY